VRQEVKRNQTAMFDEPAKNHRDNPTGIIIPVRKSL